MGKEKAWKEESYLIVKEDEEWLHRRIPDNFCDNKFMRIILFYVLHSPCKKGSYSKTSLEDFGWKNPWHKEKLKELLDGKCGFTKETFQYSASQQTFKTVWNSTGFPNEFYNMDGYEFAVFSHAGESNPHLDLLHHIRNAFAHGRFTARKYRKEYYIYMEDVKESYGILYATARIVLRKKTLLDWIEIFECKTEEAKQLCHD